MADKTSNTKLFEKRDARGKSTTAPAADVSNYLSGNIDSSSSLGENSQLYEEQRSFALLNQPEKAISNRKSQMKPEGKNRESKFKGNKYQEEAKKAVMEDTSDPYTLAEALKTYEINQIYKDTFPYQNLFNGTIANKNDNKENGNKIPIVPPLQLKKGVFDMKTNKDRETIVPTPDQGFNSIDIHDGFEDQDVGVLEGLVYPSKKVDFRPEFSMRGMRHLGNDLHGTDRYNPDKLSDFEMIAESSMKPFANNSNQKPNESLDRTDINTTPSSADKLQNSVRKSNISAISNSGVGGFGNGLQLESTSMQQSSNNPLAIHVIQGIMAKSSSTTAIQMLSQQEKIEDKEDAAKNMIHALIQINLEQHNVNQNITSQEVYEMLNPDQLQLFRDSLERGLIKHVDQGISPRRSIMKNSASKPANFDFGSYPMKSWLNKKNNPGQTTMRLEQVEKHQFFQPPKPRNDLIVIKCSEDSDNPVFKITAQAKGSKLLEQAWIEASQLEETIDMINEFIRPCKLRVADNNHKLSLYLLLGLFIVVIVAIVLGIFVHFALSAVIIVGYIVGLIVMIKKISHENELLRKQIHFNVCLIIRNENERLFLKHNIKAKVGFMTEWLEFHGIQQHNERIFGNLGGVSALLQSQVIQEDEDGEEDDEDDIIEKDAQGGIKFREEMIEEEV